MKNSKVIIVGGGFGGLNAVKALKRAPLELLLIDKVNHHLFQPLLYQVATAALSSSHIASSIRGVLAKQENVDVLLANVVAIDKVKQEVKAENGEVFKYDYLILAPGSRHAYFGKPEWEAFAPGLKTIDDALLIRERILLSYERAERCKTTAQAAKFMSFIIIGAGPTGVEMAGAIAELAHHTLVGNFKHIQPEQTKIYLIEGQDQILPSFPKELADKAQRDLEKLGVTVKLNSLVTGVTAEGIWLKDQFLESINVIWAAGNQASPLLKTLDVPLDSNGRVCVNFDLSIAGFSNIFVIGDAAFFPDKNGKALPGLAPVAIQQSRYVAKIIKNHIPFADRKPFKYFDKGMMATIGKAKAIVVVGKLKISGFIAWLAWCFVHIAYLISFSNRILVMINWFYLYFFNQRRTRLITRPHSDFEEPI